MNVPDMPAEAVRIGGAMRAGTTPIIAITNSNGWLLNADLE